jgi:quinol-cytochrome oxidoreductase complex cytochrome b subunit
MYVLHIGVLPTLAFALLAGHIFLLRIHGVSEFVDVSHGESREDDERFPPFFPDHLLTKIAIGVFLIFLVSQLAIIFPVQLGEQENLAVTPEHINPEWYFYPAIRWLKLFSFHSGIVSTIVIVIIIFAWPWVDFSLERRLPGRDASIFVVAAAIVAMTVLVLIEGLS